MAIRKFQAKPPPAQYAQLVNSLVAAWRSNNASAAAPVIIIDDQQARGGFIRLWVVWDDWDGLDVRERSEIIMDAHEQVNPNATTPPVVSALGLTRKEADRMGIDYQ